MKRLLIIIAALLLVACPLTNPPPCDPNAEWPDPCFGALLDGGAD